MLPKSGETEQIKELDEFRILIELNVQSSEDK